MTQQGTARLTKIELLRLRKRLALASKIHRILKDRLSILVMEFLGIARETVEAKQSMLDAYPNLKNMYSATDDNTHVLYLKNATATISSFTSAPKTIQF